jgi:hypothetical protein
MRDHGLGVKSDQVSVLIAELVYNQDVWGPALWRRTSTLVMNGAEGMTGNLV